MNAPVNIRPSWLTMDLTERDRLLIQYCGQGLTASQTSGKFLDASRNAIIGRVHRLQNAGHDIALGNGSRGRDASGRRPRTANPLQKPPKPKTGKPAPRGRKLRIVAGVDQIVLGSGAKGVSKYDFKARAAQRAGSVGLPIDRAAAFEPIPGVEPVSFLDNRGCKWPVDGLEGNGLLACGSAKDPQHSYCDSHRFLAYREPPMRKESRRDSHPRRLQ